eukprot:c16083_g1_i1.p1 GENE.c16083_g1_i1~~c16083_g1_i1.p1  ORF type:complete len:467 (+),score=60.35 c16083_g1_i1:82-1482(+)
MPSLHHGRSRVTDDDTGSHGRVHRPGYLVVAFTILILAVPVASRRNVTFQAYIYDISVDNQDVERDVLGVQCGLVEDILGPDRLPVWRNVAKGGPSGRFSGCASIGTTAVSSLISQPNFETWFNPIPDFNVKIPFSLVVFEQVGVPGQFSYDSSAFFPITNLGWGQEVSGYSTNFHFAFSIHAEFNYTGKERFDFSGDDDVWVFLNGKLVLDLGGIHGQTPGSVTLSSIADKVGLQIGKRNTFDFFQAERHTSGSNCKFTTTIVPSNKPPRSSPASFSMNVGESLMARLPSYDPEGDQLQTLVFLDSSNPASRLLNFSADQSTFTFQAPLSLGPTSITVQYQFVYSVRDGEFGSCNSTVTISVKQIIPPSPPPPSPVYIPPAIPPPVTNGLSKTAKIAIIAGASSLVLIGIIAAIIMILYLRSQVAGWTADITAQIMKDSAQHNPLYVPENEEYNNPLFVGAGDQI